MTDDTFEYITTDFMVSIDSGTPSIQPIEYIIELGEQGIPGVQGEQGEPGYSPVVNYTWNNDTIQFTLVNRDYTETTPNLYDYVLKRDGSNANNPITLNHLTMGYAYGSPYINSDNNLYIRGEIISLQANNRVTYNNKEIATVNDIGNGTITLTQGGVTKGTFTTNQSGNTTIELDAGDSNIPNPLNIGYVDQGVARTLNLGIDTSNNKIVSSYTELTGGSYYRAPIYFLENIASPLVGTVNSIGAIDLSINTMVGTDGTTDGVAGTVPAPLATDAGKYLRADGTWQDPPGSGGTSDYIELTNKPQINSITLTGNKSASDLGLQEELINGTGILISGNTISVDDSVVAMRSDIPDVSNFVTNSSLSVTLQDYQPALESGTNIKTINNQSLLGSGNIEIQSGGTYSEGTGIDITNGVISVDTDTVALKSDIPSLTGYATENWVTNRGYLTSISSTDVITALGYTPYSASNPNGYTNNIGTVTSVNNVQPDANGNVSINIPDTSNLVTTNTTQTISGIKTFTNAIHTDLIQNISGNVNLFSYSSSSFSIGTANTRLFLYGNTLRPTYYYNGNVELALLSDIPTVPTTDQTYNSTSTNPQSGTAVAEAIAGINIDEIVTDLNGKADVDFQNCTFTPMRSDVVHIVETYVNGSSWYKVWSNGFKEQGGKATGTPNITLSFLKPFNTTNYTVNTTTLTGTGDYTVRTMEIILNTQNVNGVTLQSCPSFNGTQFYWVAQGY